MLDEVAATKPFVYFKFLTSIYYHKKNLYEELTIINFLNLSLPILIS